VKKPPAKRPILIILAVVIVAVIAGISYFIYRWKISPSKTLDQLPIMLINGGKAAVYSQVKLKKDSVTTQIVVASLEGDQETTIYEYVPKEIAETASDLEFSIKPEIIEDDPLIMWNLGLLRKDKPVEIKYSTKPRLEWTLCAEKKYFAEMDKLGLNAMVFDDCTKYIEMRFEEAVERNKRRREQELNDQVQLIKPGEEQYQEIKKTAQKTITETEKETTRKGCTNSKESVISQIRQNYNEVNALDCYSNVEAECDGTCNKSSGRWEIVCSRNSFGSEYSEYEFWFTFYVGDPDGKIRKVGNYTKRRSYDISNKVWEDYQTYGKPQFGIR
jgi:hypothetical protein